MEVFDREGTPLAKDDYVEFSLDDKYKTGQIIHIIGRGQRKGTCRVALTAGNGKTKEFQPGQLKKVVRAERFRNGNGNAAGSQEMESMPETEAARENAETAIQAVDQESMSMSLTMAGKLAMRPEDALAVIRATDVFMREVMKEGIDYGTVPGVQKPFLFKPGAAWMMKLYGYGVTVHIVSEDTTIDWGELSPEGEWIRLPFFDITTRADIHHLATGKLIGSGLGNCNSREDRYMWRNAQRVCPNCGKPEIFESKPEYGGGYYCWNNKSRGHEGCGAKFQKGDPLIESQAVGRVLNVQIAGLKNTILKQSAKRSVSDGVLVTTAASRWFTQDKDALDSMGTLTPGQAFADIDDAHVMPVNEPESEPQTPPAGDVKEQPQGPPVAPQKSTPPPQSPAPAPPRAYDESAYTPPTHGTAAQPQAQPQAQPKAQPPTVKETDDISQPPTADMFATLKALCQQWQLLVSRQKPVRVQFPNVVFEAMGAPIPQTPEDAWIELRTLSRGTLNKILDVLRNPENIRMRLSQLDDVGDWD